MKTIGRAETRTLCAVLLNPPLRPAHDTISHRNLLVALPMTGCQQLSLANLVDLPTKDQSQLATLTLREPDLARSRRSLAELISSADEVLFAWGTGRLTGETGRHLKAQVRWVRSHALGCGVRRVWMVAGTPRHPSRWRQYVGPEKGRVAGSTFEERLAKVLACHSLADGE